MPVAYRTGASFSTSNDTFQNHTINFTAALAGSLLIVHVVSPVGDGSNAATMQSPGWTVGGTATYGAPGGYSEHRVFYKVAGAGESQFVIYITGRAALNVVEYTGIDPSYPVFSVTTSSSTTGQGVYIPRDGSMLVGMPGITGYYSQFDTFTPPGGMTGRHSAYNGQGSTLAYLSDEPRNTGNTGDRSFSWTTSSNSQSVQSSFLMMSVVAAPPPPPPQNLAPSAPGAFTSPNGGTFNESVTATWGAASDPEGQGLVYGLDLTTDGTNYTRVYTGSATSVGIDLRNFPNTGTARFRVHANDGSQAGPTTTSNPFTINHNVAPNAPTLNGPVGNPTFDRNATQRFSWTFSDPNPGDTQSVYALRARIVNTTTWTVDTGEVNSPNNFRDFPGGTFAAGSWEWQVFTRDAQGVGGPFSASAFFTAANVPNGPTITAPTNGATIPQNTATLSWSYPVQQAYQVRKVADNAGSPNAASIFYDSGIVENTGTRSVVLSFPTNSRLEHLQVRIRENNLWSAYSSVRVLVSYTQPAVPTLRVTADNRTASITLAITQPAATGTQPTVTGHDVEVRALDVGDPQRPLGAVTRIASVAGTAYIDRAPAPGIRYEYRVTALGNNGTATASAWVG
jgi:hypothetical protein